MKCTDSIKQTDCQRINSNVKRAIRRFLVFRNGSIGNTLVAVPALRALRMSEPNAFIGAVVDSLGHNLLRYCPYIDHFFIYEKRGLHHRSLRTNVRFIQSLRSFGFTHSLHFKRFWRNGFLSWATGIPQRIGFRTEGKAPFLTKTTSYIEGKNIIDLNLDLVRMLGVDSQDLWLELWFSEKEKQTVEYFFQESAIQHDDIKIGIHVGGASERGWPIERYAAVSDLLRYSLSAQPIFLYPPPDRNIVDNVIRIMKGQAFIEPPHFTILDRAELIRRCDLFIGNDSGPSHIADAVNTPAVIFYERKPDLQRHLSKWKPLGEQYRALTTEQSVEECIHVCEHMLALRPKP